MAAIRSSPALTKVARALSEKHAMFPSVMLKKLSAFKRQNRLDMALAEVGRIERTLFTLDWLESPELRSRCQAGLNKSEARHALAQAVFVHKQGRRSPRPTSFWPTCRR